MRVGAMLVWPLGLGPTHLVGCPRVGADSLAPLPLASCEPEEPDDVAFDDWQPEERARVLDDVADEGWPLGDGAGSSSYASVDADPDADSSGMSGESSSDAVPSLAFCTGWV